MRITSMICLIILVSMGCGLENVVGSVDNPEIYGTWQDYMGNVQYHLYPNQVFSHTGMYGSGNGNTAMGTTVQGIFGLSGNTLVLQYEEDGFVETKTVSFQSEFGTPTMEWDGNVMQKVGSLSQSPTFPPPVSNARLNVNLGGSNSYEMPIIAMDGSASLTGGTLNFLSYGGSYINLQVWTPETNGPPVGQPLSFGSNSASMSANIRAGLFETSSATVTGSITFTDITVQGNSIVMSGTIHATEIDRYYGNNDVDSIAISGSFENVVVPFSNSYY